MPPAARRQSEDGIAGGAGGHARPDGTAPHTSVSPGPGAVQVPASGLPLVLLADGPTIGGDPVVGVAVRADLPRLASDARG